MFLDIPETRGREALPLKVLLQIARLDRDDAVGIGVSQRNRMNDSKDGSVCADSERERKYGDECEPRRFIHLMHLILG